MKRQVSSSEPMKSQSSDRMTLAFEFEIRGDGASGGGAGNLAVNIQIHRLVDEPASLGKLLADEPLQPSARGRIAALHQEAETFTGRARKPVSRRREVIEGFLARNTAAIFSEALGAIRMVQVQDRGLSERVRATIAVRMLGIAFDLGGTSVIRPRQQGNSSAASRHGRRIKLGNAMNVILRLLAKWEDFFLRPAAACHAQAGQEK